MVNVDRRAFLQSAAAVALTASMPAAAQAEASPATTKEKMIGIQVGAVSFVDEGADKVLDEFQRDAAVNTLFLATFTYGRGIAGRQVPGQPLPDHGKQEYDTGTFYGGNYATIHPQYYKNTVFQGTRATDLGDYDVLQAVLPAARKRGSKLSVGSKTSSAKTCPTSTSYKKRNYPAKTPPRCASTIPITGIFS